MKRAAGVGLVTIALAAGVLMIFVYWVKWGERQFAVMRVKTAHSQPVRAWRCHNVVRPSLAVGSNSWTLDYSWVGGMGVGDVWVNLKGDGTATVRAKEHGAEETSNVYNLSPEQVKRVATAVDESGLLCLEPYRREGYVVEDLGRFSVQVSAPGYSKLIYVDKCTTVADTWAVGQVAAALAELKDVLGKPIAWGPFGTYSSPGSCEATSNNRWRGP